MTANGPTTPKVFLSYSHDSPEHADRVLKLSDRLRADGVDCILDQQRLGDTVLLSGKESKWTQKLKK